jgi:glycosyltransferase involved in cell wall biosynthesis
MIQNKTVAAVIPVFNPEPGLTALSHSLLELYSTVVVVDDGSAENIGGFDLLPKGICLVRHEINRGKGRAIKTAIAWLKENRPDVKVAVFVDGDGQHRPNDVVKVVEKAVETDRVTLGVRDFHKAGIPFRSRLGNVVTAFLVRLMFRIPIYDTQTGLRAIPCRLFDMMLDTEGERFEYEMRLFGKLADLRESLEQVSIRTIYIASNRTSHFRPVRETVRIYRGLFGGRFLKFIGSSFAGFFVDNGVFTLLLCALAPLALDRSVDILISILAARVISASVNYLLNRHFVFRSKNRQSLSICRYAALACAVMALSYAGTFLVSTVFNACGVRITGIKIVVDLILFLLSYKLQKTWVFR